MHFSDGVPVTADDIIFTYYTYLDPSYVGSTSLSSYKIIGLKEYQTQTLTAVLERAILNTPRISTRLALITNEFSSDAWTQELQDAYWAEIEAFGVKNPKLLLTM